MKLLTFCLLQFGILTVILSVRAQAQLSVPLQAITLANANLPAVTVSLNSTPRNALPTPFIISSQPMLPPSALWFCLDPAQTIFYSGSGQPIGSSLKFDSTNPSDFDKWGLPAPGLSAARIQNLADLFQYYLPVTNTSLLAGALQVAVWEIANEANGNPFSLGNGYLSVVSMDGTSANALIATADSMLASLYTQPVQNLGNVAALSFLIDGSYTPAGAASIPTQDLVGFVPVPEPSTYGLMGTALLLGIAGLRRFKAGRRVAAV